MPSLTPNYGLQTYNTGDTAVKFLTFRTTIAGSQETGNFVIIDNAMKANADAIEAVKSLPTITQIDAILALPNYYEANGVPAFTEYRNGQNIILALAETNTGFVTLNINTLGTLRVQKYNDTGLLVDLEAGDLSINNKYLITNVLNTWVIVGSTKTRIEGVQGNIVAIGPNKTFIDSGTFNSSTPVANTVVQRDADSQINTVAPIADSNVTNRLFVNNSISDFSTEVDTKLLTKANLVGGKIPIEEIPVNLIAETFTVATVADLITLTTAQPGDMARVTSLIPVEVYILSTMPATTLGNWINITNEGGVISVNGLTGAVTLNIVNIPNLTQSLDAKVDKVTGKQLSTNDFTTAYKNKIDANETALTKKANLVEGKVPIDELPVDRDYTWTPRSAAVSAGWNAICYGEGLFVAVATGGVNRVMTSPDGITWTGRIATEPSSWRAVCYGNGLFVATAETGDNRVMTSPDGINWTARSAAEANPWRGVCYGEGLFVAVATGGTNRIMTSPDGITWTARMEPGVNIWNSVCYGDGLFVAVGELGTNNIITSPDGITWTSRSSVEKHWTSVCYGNGLFVAVAAGTGVDRVMTSPDGINWTYRTTTSTNAWQSVCYGNGLFVAVSSNGFETSMTSTDGITWIDRPMMRANEWKGVCYGNNVFAAVAWSGNDLVCTLPGGQGIIEMNPKKYSVLNEADLVTLFKAVPNDFARTTTAPVKVFVLSQAPYYILDNWKDVTNGSVAFSADATYESVENLYGKGFGNPRNTFTKYDMVNFHDGYATANEDSVLYNGVLSNAGTALAVLKNNTTYTLIADVINNTLSNRFYLVSGQTHLLNAFTKDAVIQSKQIGILKFKLTTIATITNTQVLMRYNTLQPTGTLGSITLRTMLLEGDWTNRDLPIDYWEDTYNYIALDIKNKPDRLPENYTVTFPAPSNAVAGDKLHINGVEHLKNLYGNIYSSKNNFWINAADVNNINFMENGYVKLNTTSERAYVAYNSKLLAQNIIAPNSKYTVVTDIADMDVTSNYSSVRNFVNAWNTTLQVITKNGLTKQAYTSKSIIDNSMFLASISYNANIAGSIVSAKVRQMLLEGDYTTATLPADYWENTYGIYSIMGYGENNPIETNAFMKGQTVTLSVGLDGAYFAGDTRGLGDYTWTVRRAAEANTWNSVCYGNGLFVAVSQDGTNHVMTSPDGITWTARSTPENNWREVCYGNGLFVAVAIEGTNRVMTSPDGITWTARSSVENYWESVCYGNGLFVAVSSGTGVNHVMTSPDGIRWTAITAPSVTLSVCYGSGSFVAVGHYGNIMTSPDGITWTAREAPESRSWESVCYGNGLFVAVSSASTNRLMTSPDGINWTIRTAPEENWWTSVCYGNGLFVALSGNKTNQVMTSPDGITWTSRPVTEPSRPVTEPSMWMSVCYGNGLFVAVAIDGDNRVMTSSCTPSALEQKIDKPSIGFPGHIAMFDSARNVVDSGVSIKALVEKIFPADGLTWTAREAPEANAWTSICYGNGLFVAIATTGANQVMTSPDGITWTARRVPVASVLTSVCYGNGLFVAVATGGTNHVMTSPDGITWTARSVPEGNWCSSVCCGNGLFVAVDTTASGDDRVMTSSDGEIWIQRTSPEKSAWKSICYGNGLFVAVAETGNNPVMTSTDGITWTAKRASEPSMWNSVCYGNGLFVAVATDGANRVMTSPDGITWTSRSVTANAWMSVCYGNGLFVAVAETGINRIITSLDGITWTARSAAEMNNWDGVCYANNLFVAVSGSGANRVMTNGMYYARG